jgi:transposase
MDDTGHRHVENQHGFGVLCQLTPLFFSITNTRGGKVIKNLMGDFSNIFTSDRYAAYNYFDSSKRNGVGHI